MLTGVSPFRTGSAPDTLMRICTARQVPVRELRPEVPEGMSNLVDCLLEKDPMLRPGGAREVAREFERLGGRRLTGTLEEEPTLSGSVGPPGPRQPGGADQAPPAWRWAAAGAMVLVLTGLAAVFAGRHPPAEPLPLHVAVPKPSLASPDADGRAALLVSGVRLAILQSLTGIEGIVPLASEQVDPVEGTPKEIARAVAAGEVLASRVDCGAESCRIELSRVRSDGSFLWAQSFEAPLDRPYLLPEPVAGYLREAYKDRRILAGRPRLEARPQDYVEYLKLRQTYDSEQQRDPSPEVLARIAVIRRGSPHFLEAMLLEAEMLIYRFKIRRDAMDLEKASQILQAARELAPADPRPLRDLFNLAMTRGDLTQAESVERDLMRLQPGAQLAMVEEAQLLERRGSTKEAREMMQKAVRSHPSWRNLAFAAEMDFRLGHFASARQYLEQLLDRFPGYYVGRSMLAQVELISGDSERAIELYTQIVARSPEVADVVNLGIAYMLAGRYADAEQRFRTAAGKEPKSPLIALNLGDACLLRGDATEAVTIYQHVLDLMERDPSASEWQLQSVRAQSLAHLHRPREAVEAVQEVLRLAPGNAQATYESSLVYALLGDQASALFNAERALELGVDQRWFSLPWFDALRQTPAFRGRLAALAAKSSRS
jgi:serine/threonine-protein kinase